MKQEHKDFYIHLDTPELLRQRNVVVEIGSKYLNDSKKQKVSREHFAYINKILNDRGLPNEMAIHDYRMNRREAKHN